MVLNPEKLKLFLSTCNHQSMDLYLYPLLDFDIICDRYMVLLPISFVLVIDRKTASISLDSRYIILLISLLYSTLHSQSWIYQFCLYMCCAVYFCMARQCAEYWIIIVIAGRKFEGAAGRAEVSDLHTIFPFCWIVNVWDWGSPCSLKSTKRAA